MSLVLSGVGCCLPIHNFIEGYFVFSHWLGPYKYISPTSWIITVHKAGINNIIMSKAVSTKTPDQSTTTTFVVSHFYSNIHVILVAIFPLRISQVDYLPPSMSIRFGGFRWCMLLLILIFVWCWLLFGWSWVMTWHNVVHVPSLTYNAYYFFIVF